MMKILGLGVAIIMASASPAFALEPAQCGSADEIQAALKAEGQVPVVIGNRVTTRADRPVNIFTANSNDVGYELEGDAPQGQKSTRVCVGARFHSVRINDITSASIPTWALLGNDRATAEADCKARKAGVCDSYDDYMRKSYTAGRRIMMTARTDVTNPDGSHRDGRLLTIVTIPEKKYGEVTATNRAGANESMTVLENVNFTQFAGNFIKAGN